MHVAFACSGFCIKRRPIVSIYPKRNLRIRTLFDQECSPYNKNHSKALIMWTRLGNSVQRYRGGVHTTLQLLCHVGNYRYTLREVPTVNSDIQCSSSSQKPAFPTLSKEPTICSTTVSHIQFQSPASVEGTVSSTRVMPSPSQKPASFTLAEELTISSTTQSILENSFYDSQRGAQSVLEDIL